MPNPPAAALNSSSITVIIVGLGIGALTAAISCHLKGHIKDLEPLGNGLILTPNSKQVISEFGDRTVKDWPKQWSYTCTDCKIFNTAADYVGQHPLDLDRGLSLVPRRGLVQTLYETATPLGLNLRLGVKVTEFRRIMAM
ncbi:hypothetical protein BDV12DRAFT_203690 [Aspergillus spectabilis]